MAEMFHDDDSSEKHLSASRLHIRRCRKMTGAEGLADAIAPVRTRLVGAVAVTEQREEEEEDAKDDVEVAGLAGAEVLRTLSGRAEEHDRRHNTNTHGAIFVEGGFSKLLDSKGAVAPLVLEDVAFKVRLLGEGTEDLQPFADESEAAATAIRAAEAVVEQALKARKLAEADEELAQAALRKQYEHNYLDAKKAFGARAERLFPKIRKRRKKTKTEE